MSVRRKPEKAVPELLARLSKAKGHVLPVLPDAAAARNTISTFEGIEKKLKLMTDSVSRIKNWEKEVVQQLCALEQHLDDDIFRFQGPSLPAQVSEMLSLIDEDVNNLKSLICPVEQLRKMSSMSIKHKNQAAVVAGGGTVSQEWAGVGLEDEIMESKAISILRDSIHCLEEKLRKCLLYLSVFPENTPIKKRPLIYWWMGEGIVATEEDAEKVFGQILNEGFIRPPTATNSFTFCPWVRRALIQENHYFNFSRKGTPCNSQQRAFLYAMDGGATEEDGGATKGDVLTVFNMNEQYLLGTKLDWLRGLQKVEVLQMGRWQDSPTYHIEAENFLNGLGSQKCLKYLSLRGISRIETLPPTIRKLVSLRILDLRACHNLEKLPHTISHLRNLTHLDVSECYLLESMPKGLQHLRNLQVVKGFVVDSPGRGSCMIADLVGMDHLRKLSIRVRSQGGQQLRSLKDLSDTLRILTISWMGVVASDTAELPTTLTKLDLRSVPFEEVPHWLQPSKLPNLEKLHIKGGKLKSLNRNHDRNVKFARLQYLRDLLIKQKDLVALFPDYQYLEITDCHKDQPNTILRNVS